MKLFVQSFLFVSLTLMFLSCNTANTKNSAGENSSDCCTSEKDTQTSCCSGNEETKLITKSEAIKDSIVMVYYFHSTRRCETCEAVEAVTKATIEKSFMDEAVFTSLNRDDESVKSIVDKFKISGQTLLIVYGDKMENITNEAFLNARTNPEKLSEKLSSVIKSMLNS